VRLIETQHQRIPWRWVFSIALLDFAMISQERTSGDPLTFTLKKFFDNPALIGFIASFNIVFNILVGAVCLYVSDRIWTRYGRRRPFIVFSLLGVALCFVFIPLTGNAWLATTLVIVWLAMADVGATAGALNREIIPPLQRGRAAAIANVILYLQILFFYTFVIGRFDDVRLLRGLRVTGEQMIYWFAAILLVLAALFVGLCMRERKPLKSVLGERISFVGFFASIFCQKRLWPVYMLSFAQAITQINLGPIAPLLYTEQWGYTKQQMGTNIAIGTAINIVLTIIIGFFADKFDRIKMFLAGLTCAFVLNIVWYCFVQFYLPDKRPELWQIIVFGEMIVMVNLVGGMVAMPLLYDYVPRDNLSTCGAGMGIIRSVARLLVINGTTLFVAGWSRFYCAPGQYDYFSALLLAIAIQGLGIGVVCLFVWMVKRGMVQAWGRMDIGAAPERSGAGAQP